MVRRRILACGEEEDTYIWQGLKEHVPACGEEVGCDFVCMYIFKYVCVYMYTYVCVCIYIYMYICMYIYICMYVCKTE